MACNFIKKETLAQVFSCEFCKNFKTTFFTEQTQVATSVCYKVYPMKYMSKAVGSLEIVLVTLCDLFMSYK